MLIQSPYVRIDGLWVCRSLKMLGARCLSCKRSADNRLHLLLIYPVLNHRLHIRSQSGLVGVAILYDDPLYPIRMSRRDAISDRSPKIENVHKARVNAEGDQKRFDDLGDVIERVNEVSAAAARRGSATVTKPRVIRCDEMHPIAKPIH